MFDFELFRNPTSEYRGTPFWSWNNKLDRRQLFQQIEVLRQMGFGGFHAHSRTGLDTNYLSPEYLQLLRDCTLEAKRLGMLSWLYDEDRWPSGFAGGLVTKDPALRARQLLWTCRPYRPGEQPGLVDYGMQKRSGNGQLVARYAVTLRDGRLASYRRLQQDEKPPRSTRTWYAYLEPQPPSRWFGFQTYLDTFNPAATRRFIEITHETFKQSLGEFFGNVIPAIFTDEPQFTKKTILGTTSDENDQFMPISDDFFETYRATYHQRLEDHLPELFWNLADDRPSVVRWRYHAHTVERFATGFCDVLGHWCDANGIALTGHMIGEETLASQTRGTGEAMRPLRFFHLPGIDQLCDDMELTTAKQAQSVARQCGREGVTSELYGVTNWDFDFVGHKAQGDWQAALGVTVRVPHLSWVSMAGESKRDYPAPIDQHSPWWQQYPLIENHFSRLNTVLTRGSPLVRLAVVHPVESYWLHVGPAEHNAAIAGEQEQQFQSLTRWLCHSLVDFDFISEAMLPTLETGVSRGRLHVGAARYDAVILPNLQTIRSGTLDLLLRFAKERGTLLVAGDPPRLVDARPAPRLAAKLARRARIIPFTRLALIDAIEPLREIDVRHADGSRADSLLHQFRADGRKRHLFLCNTDRRRPRRGSRIRVRGRWSITRLDTMSGTSHPVASSVANGWTEMRWNLEAHDHLLLMLEPRSGAVASKTVPDVVTPEWREVARLADPVPVTLSEPNVLLLDQPDWRVNDETWQPAEEALRIDEIVRRRFGLPSRAGRIPQPWTDRSPTPVVAQVQLRYALDCTAPLKAPRLAIETPPGLRLALDGHELKVRDVGSWVDDAIRMLELPSLSVGRHELLLTVPFTRRTDLEWCYLLGDFGVSVHGRHARITAPVRELAWGDWTRQGLPFYAGNVTYHCTLPTESAAEALHVPHFRNPLLRVTLDGNDLGPIAFAPFRVLLGRLATDGAKPDRTTLDRRSRPSQLDLLAFGNRVNAFGPLHHADRALRWVGPQAWRSTNADWSYEYQLKPTGILSAPILLKQAR